MSITELMHKLQKELKAPKSQYNKFGGYNYRSCEDILDGIKKILPDNVYLTLNDEMVQVSNRVYVRSTATLKSGDEQVSCSAYAREPESKKGMDESQITGAASSYARKYALNGLFCIDDTKDADTNEHKKEVEPKKEAPKLTKEQQELKDKADNINKQLQGCQDLGVLDYVWAGFKEQLDELKKASPDKAYPALEKTYRLMKDKLPRPQMEAAG